eukprot:sb/3463225/
MVVETKVRFKRLDLRFLEIQDLPLRFSKSQVKSFETHFRRRRNDLQKLRLRFPDIIIISPRVPSGAAISTNSITSGAAMTSVIKELVSKKKRRFVADGYNLDLAYIKPNIVAMGFPANNVEAWYRNNIEDVFKFFEEKHSGHYKIYNLCKERQRNYLLFAKGFHRVKGKLLVFRGGKGEYFGKTLLQRLNLAEDEQNVAVIHCKAGKGRTGVMIVSYLLHEGIYEQVCPALQFYGEARTFDTKGVTIPSQRRYVYYYGDYVSRGFPPYEAESLLLTKIRLVKMPHSQSGTINLSFNISIGYIKIYTSAYTSARRDLEHIDLVPRRTYCKERLCQFWLNLFFVRLRTKTGEEDSCAIGGSGNEYVVTLTKPELDKINKDKRDKIVPKDFKVEIYFSECSNRLGGNGTSDLRAAAAAPSSPDYFNISIGYIKIYTSAYTSARRDLEHIDLVPRRTTPVCGDIKIEIFTKNLTKERLCQFWLNLFFVRLRTKTGEEDSCAIGGSGNEYVVTLTKPELDKINKDKRDKIVPKDFKVEIYFSECSNRLGGNGTSDLRAAAAAPSSPPEPLLSGDPHVDPDPDTDTDLDSDQELDIPPAEIP